jgi:hypothetical protein
MFKNLTPNNFIKSAAFLFCAAFLFFILAPAGIAQATTCVWNSHGSTNMNLVSNYYGAGCTLGTSDDLQFTGTSTVAATATGNLKVGSITTLSAYTGSWSLATFYATSTDNIGMIFDNSSSTSGTLNLGSGITLSGNSATLHIGHGVGTVTAGSCAVVMSGTGMTLQDNKGTTFRNLTLGANAAVTVSGSAANIYFQESSGGSSLTLGNGSTFTSNQTVALRSTASSTIINLPASYTLNGTGLMYIQAYNSSGNAVITIPGFTRTTGPVQISSRMAGTATFNFNGNMNLNSVTMIAANGGSVVFNTNNHSITASGIIVTGSAMAGSTATYNFGSSTVSILSYDSSANNTDASFLNLQTSRWTFSGAGGWVNGSSQAVNPGTSLVTFTNTAPIKSRGKSFYDIAINASGKIITLYDNLTAHNFNIISAKSLNASSTITTIGGNLTIATSTTFNHLIMSSTTVRTITVAAGKTLTLNTLTASDLNRPLRRA